jgi:hypothetical protein
MQQMVRIDSLLQTNASLYRQRLLELNDAGRTQEFQDGIYFALIAHAPPVEGAPLAHTMRPTARRNTAPTPAAVAAA